MQLLRHDHDLPSLGGIPCRKRDRAPQPLHTGQMLCHYCLASSVLPDKCPVCGKKLSLFGLGTQRVEEELGRKMPDLKFARVDSDSMRTFKDYESTLARFARGELQVILGTQMIAKGLDFPNVTLVGVISGDTALALPGFSRRRADIPAHHPGRRPRRPRRCGRPGRRADLLARRSHHPDRAQTGLPGLRSRGA